MQIVIDIPKQFENHFNNDRFMDSLNRIIFDIEQCNQHGAEYDALSGNYEIETLRMLKDSILDSKKLSKGHGRLIDADDIRVIELEDSLHIIRHEKGDEVDVYIDAPTIIEADKAESEEKNEKDMPIFN